MHYLGFYLPYISNDGVSGVQISNDSVLSIRNFVGGSVPGFSLVHHGLTGVSNWL